ncbi:MAG: ArsB/NhaD family transporter [Alphaproteobacteria bacterium]|nr:ArsB/NhaD family transporter [Alphaproteobacteria bacterium]
MDAHILPQVIFGLNPQILATSILVISYIILFTEKLNRAVVALLGASVMIFTGILTQSSALAGIDFNTISLLIGMMIIVGIAEKSGMFQYVAIKSAKLVKASPRGLLIMLSVVTAIFSALLDNVTTVLLIVPVTFQITRNLKINPYPFLILEIFASNIGGTATLIGDPPNILIGSALNLSFMDFVKELTLIVVITMVVLIAVFDFVFGRKLTASQTDKAKIMKINETDSITNYNLLYKSLGVLALTIIGFISAEYIHINNGTIALFGAALLLMLYTLGDKHQERDQKVEDAFSLVDWTTIFFFCGLFAIVYGLEVAGVLELLGQKFIEITEGSIKKATFLVLWVSAIVSTAIDNIPFVATMIPLLKTMEPSMGGREAMMPVWWALSLGSCFGGNGSLIAASANVIVAGFATREGHSISFIRFLIWSIPVMLVSITMAMIYLYIIHFM